MCSNYDDDIDILDDYVISSGIPKHPVWESRSIVSYKLSMLPGVVLSTKSFQGASQYPLYTELHCKFRAVPVGTMLLAQHPMKWSDASVV